MRLQYLTKKIAICLLAFAFVSAPAVTGRGASVSADSDSASESGRLTFVYECGGVALSGAEISVYKTADASLSDGMILYSLVDALSDYSVPDSLGRETIFDDMTTDESNALAEEWAQAGLEPVCAAVTDGDGCAVIGDLEYGIYLIVQTGADGVSADYMSFEPYLISVPVPGGEAYETDITLYPKTEKQSLPEETSQSSEETQQSQSAEETSEITAETADGTALSDNPSTLIAGIGNEKLVLGLVLLTAGAVVFAVFAAAGVLFLKGRRDEKERQ